jgi:hypothetical protein
MSTLTPRLLVLLPQESEAVYSLNLDNGCWGGIESEKAALEALVDTFPYRDIRLTVDLALMGWISEGVVFAKITHILVEHGHYVFHDYRFFDVFKKLTDRDTEAELTDEYYDVQRQYDEIL